MLLAFVCAENTTKIDPQVGLPVFENIILCPDALSGRESASMATFFDMALLLVYSILVNTKDVYSCLLFSMKDLNGKMNSWVVY